MQTLTKILQRVGGSHTYPSVIACICFLAFFLFFCLFHSIRSLALHCLPNQSNACLRLAGTFVDDNSYTFGNYLRDSRCSCRDRMHDNSVAHFSALSSRTLGSHRLRLRLGATRSSSHSCAHFGCATVRGRATGRSL